MLNTSQNTQRIRNELAYIAAKLDNTHNHKGKLQFRIDVTTAISDLDRVSKELARISDEALPNEFTQLRHCVEQTAKGLGVTTTRISYNSSLSDNSYASFLVNTNPFVSSIAQKSLNSLSQLQQKLASVPPASRCGAPKSSG